MTGAETGAGAATPRRPNILLLMLDQQAASALSAYGGPARTPAIQGLADRGVVFDNAHTNFPVCAPSRCSMLSGQLASRIGCYDNAAEFPAATPTFAHYLRWLGFQTSLCGKMHFVGPDLLHGYEERLTPEIYSADFRTLPQWEAEDDDFATDAGQALAEAGPVARSVQMDYDEEVAFRAEQKLFDLARSDDPRPFFLTVSFTHPHEPFLCRQEDWDRYTDAEIPLPRVAPPADPDPYSRLAWQHYQLPVADAGDRMLRNARRAYYGSMSWVDARIGRLLAVLAETGLARETVILLTSDHGEMLGERGLWFKKVFFRDAVEVPLLLAGPGFAPRRVAENVSLVDLLPTLLDLADPDRRLTPVAPLAGQSLLPLARGEGRGWPDTVLSEMTCEGVREPVVMVRRGAWKYITSASLPPLLFDLATDGQETENLAGRPSVAAREAELAALVDATWGDLDVLRATIIRSQKARLLVREALDRGRVTSWDDPAPPPPGGDRYLRRGRSYNAWNYGGVDRLRRQRPT